MKLMGVPGRLDLYGGGDYNLDLRGFGSTADSNQVIVVDGVRISEADTGGTRLAGINIDTVERIEVIHGSGAVLYGEGATGGVISITTKAGAGVERLNNADVYAAAGRYGLRDVRAASTLSSSGFSLDLAANKREADNHRDNFRSRNEGYALTGQWRNAWLRGGIRVAQDKLDSGMPGGISDAQYNSNPRVTNFPNDNADIRNTRYGVFAQAQLAGWQIGADAGWRTKNLDSIFSGFPYIYDIQADNQALRARRELNWAGVRHVIATGVDFDGWKRQFPGSSSAHQRSRAVYLKDDLSFAGGTRVAAGIRTEHLDKNDSFGNAVKGNPQAWELGLTQPLGHGFSAYGRVGRSFRYPNADEYSFTTPGAALLPQDSHDTELGARWADRQSRIDMRLYRSALQREIGYDPTAPGPYPGSGANVNFDRTRRQGVELEASHSVSKTVNLGLNAALRRAEFVAGPHDGKQTPLAPKVTAAVRGDWRFLPQHRVDASVRYIGPQHPDFDNQCAMPSYTTADVRYAYQVGTLELALALANVADKRYYTQAFVCDTSTRTTNGIYPEPRRAAVASLRWSFF